jgi:hypothetical protein
VDEREVSVGVFETETEALMWAGALESEGIPCVLVPLAAGAAAWGATVWRPFQIRVRASDAERAREILPDRRRER